MANKPYCPKCGEPNCEERPLAISTYIHCRVCDDGEPTSVTAFIDWRSVSTEPRHVVRIPVRYGYPGYNGKFSLDDYV